MRQRRQPHTTWEAKTCELRTEWAQKWNENKIETNSVGEIKASGERIYVEMNGSYAYCSQHNEISIYYYVFGMVTNRTVYECVRRSLSVYTFARIKLNQFFDNCVSYAKWMEIKLASMKKKNEWIKSVSVNIL